MTTDDNMREIEAALTDFAGNAIAMDTQWLPERDKLLALIRQKLPQTDAEHERAIELTNDEREAMKEPGVYAIDGRIVGVVDATATPVGRMVRMSARPLADEVGKAADWDAANELMDEAAVLPMSFVSRVNHLIETGQNLFTKCEAAGELLRAAKDVLHNFHVDMEQENRCGFYGPQDVDAMIAMSDAIEAAERAGVTP